MEKGHTFLSQYNPIIGRMQWKEVDPEYDYNQEIARSGYGDMLHDTDRNRKYYQAIAFTIKRLKSCNPDKAVNVLDIGTGTGLLSMMAASAGADSVYACEAFEPVARCAKRVIKDNNLDDKIVIIPKRSTDLVVGQDLPQRANVLVAELFDTELIGESALETYRHAADNLLTEDAVLIPSSAQLFLQVVESPFLWSHHRIFPINSQKDNQVFDLHPFHNSEVDNCHGAPSVFDLQVSELDLVSHGQLQGKQVRCLLDKPVFVKHFNFGPRSSAITLAEHGTLTRFEDGSEIRANQSGLGHAFIVWWSLQMEPTNTTPSITIAPEWLNDPEMAWRDHWMQAVYFPHKPLRLNQDDPLAIRFAHDSVSMWFDFANKLDPNSDSSKLERPICTCGMHCSWSRHRIAQLNSDEHHSLAKCLVNKAIEDLSSTQTPSIMIFISDCTYLPFLMANALCNAKGLNNNNNNNSMVHIDTSYFSAKFLDTIYKLSDLHDTSKLQLVTSVQELMPRLNQHLNNETESKSNIILISEPYSCEAILPWDSLYFWYTFQSIVTQLPDHVGWTKWAPNRLRIFAVAVEFRDLWKIRSPVELTCEDFDLRSFDKFLLTASAQCDAPVEPQPLWEYPSRARSRPKVVFEMELANSHKLGDEFMNFPKQALILREGDDLELVSPNVNGIAFWAEWLYDLGEPSNSEIKQFWYAPSGPSTSIVPNDFIEWKPNGIQQGVYLPLSNWEREFSSNGRSSYSLNVTANFTVQTGEILFSVRTLPNNK